jgi:hypothetical protein
MARIISLSCAFFPGKSLKSANIFHLNSSDYHLQFGPGNRGFISAILHTLKLPLFQPFHPYAVPAAIEIQELELGLASVDKNKTLAIERILLQEILYHRHQAIKGFPHVGGLGVQPYLF